MIIYFLSGLNIWAAWSIWTSEEYKYLAIVPLAISLILFLQQRDRDEMENSIEKDDN